MKTSRLLTVSLVAFMAVGAARAEIATTSSVTKITGALGGLNTTAKDNLVNAINSVNTALGTTNDKLGTVESDVGQLKTDVAGLETDLEDYATKTYADDKASEAQSAAEAAANKHTDDALKDYTTTENLARDYALKTYADGKASEAQSAATSAANTYTDNALKNYTTTEDLEETYATQTQAQDYATNAKTEANSYTDSKITGLSETYETIDGAAGKYAAKSTETTASAADTLSKQNKAAIDALGNTYETKTDAKTAHDNLTAEIGKKQNTLTQTANGGNNINIDDAGKISVTGVMTSTQWTTEKASLDSDIKDAKKAGTDAAAAAKENADAIAALDGTYATDEELKSGLATKADKSEIKDWVLTTTFNEGQADQDAKIGENKTAAANAKSAADAAQQTADKKQDKLNTEQLAAVNSGITAEAVEKLASYIEKPSGCDDGDCALILNGGKISWEPIGR